jgi:hypothetical protein
LEWKKNIPKISLKHGAARISGKLLAKGTKMIGRYALSFYFTFAEFSSFLSSPLVSFFLISTYVYIDFLVGSRFYSFFFALCKD